MFEEEPNTIGRQARHFGEEGACLSRGRGGGVGGGADVTEKVFGRTYQRTGTASKWDGRLL